MNNKIYSLILFCSLWFSGCESLINDLDQDKLPKTEIKLVVECYISPQSEEIRVKVTESQPLFAPSTYETNIVKNATVIISGENGQLQIPYNDSISTYVIDSSYFRIEAGKKYTLTVNDGIRNVKASCVVPLKKATIKTMEVDTVVSQWSPQDSVARVKMSWEDIRGETNYYQVRGYSGTEATRLVFDPPAGTKPERGYFKNLLDYNYNSILYNDVNLDGITFNTPYFMVQLDKNWVFTYIDKSGKEQTVNSNPILKEIHIEVLNIDENYYKFYRSRKNNDDGNPFVEPTLVFTNIEGGLGCFGSYTIGSATVRP